VLTIRPALPHEYTAIGLLTADAYAPVLTFGSADPYREVLQDAAGRATAAELWAALADERLVGTVTVCRPGTPYAEIASAGELEVRMLAVSPRAQGSRVGATLMSAVHDLALREGFDAVVLSVVETNTPAATFYSRLGYTRSPDRDWTPVPNITLQVWRRRVEPA
jgi:GNAT superfamily N-acetyltransferase